MSSWLFKGEVLNITFPLYAGKVLFLPREPGTTIAARTLWVCNPDPVALDDSTSSSEDDRGG